MFKAARILSAVSHTRSFARAGIPGLMASYAALVPRPSVKAKDPLRGTLTALQSRKDPSIRHVRTLVLCFDGTGEQFDEDNSNVVQFFSLLKKDDPKEQMVYYQAGLGTFPLPWYAVKAKLSEQADKAFAWNLSTHVIDGYKFLMQNYVAGDKICLFGFSRGAYIARAMAGMVYQVGLLPRGNLQQIPYAYDLYKNASQDGGKQSKLFKKTFSMDVDIEFIGVWDTVRSVGLISRELPFTSSNTSVKTFRHAVSLDERRVKLRANLFKRKQKEEQPLGTQPGDMPKAGEDIDSENTQETPREPVSEVIRTNGDRGIYAPDEGTKSSQEIKTLNLRNVGLQEQLETDVLEVWFAGCHGDVGGGSVPNGTRHNLARIPLRWMIRECFLSNTCIRFHRKGLRGVGFDIARLDPEVLDRPDPLYWKEGVPIPDGIAKGAQLTEEEEDLADALSPTLDQLKLKKSWWFLEFFPIPRRIRLENGLSKLRPHINIGRGRDIPDHPAEVHIHRSVDIRMQADSEAFRDKKYKPNPANWDKRCGPNSKDIRWCW